METILNNPLLILLIALPVWFAMVYLVGRKWRRVAAVYPYAGQVITQKRYFGYVWLGGASYSNCLIVGKSREGLYLAIIFIFRLGHPPVFIPWSDITFEEKKIFFVRALQLKLTRAPGISLIFLGKRMRQFLART